MPKSNLMTNPKMEAIEAGFELISEGVLIIEQHRGFLEELGGKNAIDTAARINALSNAMVTVLDRMKEKLKAEEIAGHTGDGEWKTEKLGNKYMAVISRSFRTVADMDLVETLLAKVKKAVPKKRQSVVQVAFEVKK